MTRLLAVIVLAGILAGGAAAHEFDNVFVYVQKEGQGFGRVHSDPYGIDCGPTCVSQFPGNWEADYRPVTLFATPEPGSTFAGWKGGCSGTSPSCTVELAQAQLVVAVFDGPPRRQHRVGVSFTGRGAVASVEQPGVSCGQTCAASFDEGRRITIRAIADPGWYFERWTGGCAGSVPICSLLVDGPKTVGAVFLEFGDAEPPSVTALGSSGRRGEVVRLRYLARDNRGRTRETAVVYRGTRALARVKGTLGDRSDESVLFYFLAWRAPKAIAPGALRFCVRSTDAAGNTSRESCAALRLR